MSESRPQIYTSEAADNLPRTLITMDMTNRQLHMLKSRLGNWDEWPIKLRFIMLEDEKVRVNIY